MTSTAFTDTPHTLSTTDVLRSLVEGETLSEGAAMRFMDAVLDQQVPDAQLAASLAILRHRGERPDEMAGFLRSMLARCVPVAFDGPLLVDPVGTGGDGLHTYNISTMTSLVLAGMDIPVAKHGNRKASSKSGSSDALESAGVPIIADVERLQGALSEVGLAFLFAPYHHPGLRHVAALRQSLGVMTTFNLLGPLANPAPVTHQLLGVARADILEAYAKAAASRGVRAYVVHGDHGADEALPTGDFLLVRGAGQAVERIDPRSYGATLCSLSDLQGGSPEENAEMLWDVLRGAGPEPVTQAVALNTALMLELIGRARTPKEAFEMAIEAIRSGQSGRRLERYIHYLQPLS